MKRSLLAAIGAYSRWISPGFPRRCRYEPTCSAYAVEAINELGAIRGALLGGWRLLRCNPFSPGGIDDVADRRIFRARPRTSSVAPQPAARPQSAGGAK